VQEPKDDQIIGTCARNDVNNTGKTNRTPTRRVEKLPHKENGTITRKASDPLYKLYYKTDGKHEHTQAQ